MLTLKKAIFLDRDGTLNEDPGYLNHPDEVSLISGVQEALTRLKSFGFLLIVVTNQSGVSRGYLSLNTLNLIHRKMNLLLGPKASIDRFYACWHHPRDFCSCRKPGQKLMHLAASELRIDLSESYFVGDRVTDILAGKSFLGTSLVLTGQGEFEKEKLGSLKPSYIAKNLNDFADWVLNQE